MKNIIILFTILIISLITACTDVVELDLPDGEVKLVVDGWLTNQPGEKQVIISRTDNYFNEGLPPRVSGALVVLYDENGPVDTLVERVSEEGMYLTYYEGHVGSTYHLYIRTVEGEEYESLDETLRSVSPITKLEYELKEDDPFFDDGYYIQLFSFEPAGKGDHYRWKQYINDTLQNLPEDIIVVDDEFVDGNVISGFEISTQPLDLGDHFRVEQMSISREAYEFFFEIQSQTAFVGSIFDSPPIPIEGNIVNKKTGEKALGFFGVSAVEEAEIVIE